MSIARPSVGSRAPLAWRATAPAAALARWAPTSVRLPDGAETEAVALGTGPGLLLLPPLPGWKEALWPQVVAFSERWRTVTYDLREAGAGPLTWDALLSDLDAVAGALLPGRTALLGHSLGGALALQWAAIHPERASALVLSSTYARIRWDPSVWRTRFLVQGLTLATQRWLPEGVALAVARGLARRGAWVYDPSCSDALLRLVREAVRSTRPRTAAARVALARDFDARVWVGRVRCPTLVVVGELESRAARASAEELATRIAGAEQRVVAGGNHLLHLSRAEAYNEVVGRWLEERVSGGREPCAAR